MSLAPLRGLDDCSGVEPSNTYEITYCKLVRLIVQNNNTAFTKFYSGTSIAPFEYTELPPQFRAREWAAKERAHAIDMPQLKLWTCLGG